MADNNLPDEIRQLRAEVAAVGATLNEVKAMMANVHAAVQTDHQKLEELEATSKGDYKMIRALEESRRNLEVSGRIQVGRPPVGL